MSSLSINTATLSSGQGLDVDSVVNQLVTSARAPERNWQAQQQKLQTQADALGQLNTALFDLWDKVNALKDVSGATGAVSASSSNSSLVTATASGGTAPGTHVVVVNSLATTSSYYSDAVASATATLADGSFTLQVGTGTPATITIDSSNNTLTKLAASINAQNLGVTASVITDATGARLALVAKNSGAAGDIAVSGDASGLNLTKAVDGANASLTVDGVPISSASNTVSGVVSGVSFNLNGAAVGTQVSISITPNTDAAVTAINDFVSSYNTLMQQLNTQFTYNPASKTGGPLAGDTNVRLVQQEILGFASFTTGDASYGTLRSLGITMNNDGTLSLDGAKLNDTVKNHFTEFKNFFQSTSTGFGHTVSPRLLQLSSPTQGAFSVEIKGIQSTKSALQDEIDNFEVYIASRQQQWFLTYERVDVMLRQLPLLQSQIQAQLGFVGGDNNK